MAKRYVLTTKTPVPGNCNHLTKSGHYCANRVRTADHCAANHPINLVAAGLVSRGAHPDGRIVDSPPEIETSGEMTVAERIDEFLERLQLAAQKLGDLERNNSPDSAEALRLRSKQYGVIGARRSLEQLTAAPGEIDDSTAASILADYVDGLQKDLEVDDSAAASLLAGYIDGLQKDLYGLPPAELQDDDRARVAGWTEGVKLAISYLEEMDLLPEEIEVADSTGPLETLDAMIESLPKTHPDRRGLVRARELLRTEGVAAPPSGGKSAPADEALIAAESANDAARGALEWFARSGYIEARIGEHGKRSRLDLKSGEMVWECRCGASWPCPLITAYEALDLPIPESVDRDRIKNPSREKKLDTLRQAVLFVAAERRGHSFVASDVAEDESLLRSVFGVGAEQVRSVFPEVDDLRGVANSPEELDALLDTLEAKLAN